MVSILSSEDIPVDTGNEVSSRMNIGGQTSIRVPRDRLGDARTLLDRAEMGGIQREDSPPGGPASSPERYREYEADFSDGGWSLKTLIGLILVLIYLIIRYS